MKAGSLRHKVTIQRVSQTLDSSRQTVDLWTKVDDVWAAVEPLTGRELVNAQQIQPDVTHLVKIRYRDDVTAKMRVLHGSRVLNIEGPPINIEERDRELHLMCRERI